MSARLARCSIVLLCLAIAAQTLVLWNATGRDGLTKYFDPARAERDAKAHSGDGLGDLFAGTGLEDSTGPLAKAPNKFALGLAPAGAGKHIVSVLTLAGPAALAALLALLLPVLDRRAKR